MPKLPKLYWNPDVLLRFRVWRSALDDHEELYLSPLDETFRVNLNKEKGNKIEGLIYRNDEDGLLRLRVCEDDFLEKPAIEDLDFGNPNNVSHIFGNRFLYTPVGPGHSQEHVTLLLEAQAENKSFQIDLENLRIHLRLAEKYPEFRNAFCYPTWPRTFAGAAQLCQPFKIVAIPSKASPLQGAQGNISLGNRTLRLDDCHSVLFNLPMLSASLLCFPAWLIKVCK